MRKRPTNSNSGPHRGHALTRPAGIELRLQFEALEERRLLTGAPESLGEINPGGPSNPAEFVNAGGVAFFSANNGASGQELWKTDGTMANTLIVKDIWPMASGSSPKYLTAVGGTLFFAANDGSSGVELWKSDGTTAGTTLVKDINPLGDSSPTRLTNVGGTLYFAADDGMNGAELWKSDGTMGGTTMVMDIHSSAGSDPRYLTNVGGKLFFVANDGVNGTELWMSDPGTASTMLLKDINPGSEGSNPGYFNALANVGGILYFSATDAANGFELWKSDGTMGGTTIVKDISPGEDGSFPFVMTNVSGTLFFTAADGSSGFELWKSDGTGGGTVPVADINTSPGAGSGPDGLTNMNGTLYFRASDGANGIELWKSDGSAPGTEMVLNINPAGSSMPRYLTNVNGTLFFRADDGANGVELWKSDGLPGGTSLVADIAPGSINSNPRSLANISGTLFFSAETTANNQEPWVVHGPSASVVGTKLFYNQSKFDGNDPAAGTSDDSAIAPDKIAYLPVTGQATFDSVSSHPNGITGVMIDLAGPHGPLSAADFIFRVGANNAPWTWATAPAPQQVMVRTEAGSGGSDRVELIWANGAITKTWLQVTAKVNLNTNLAAPYTFLFGNAVGDSGTGNSPTLAITNSTDQIAARDSFGINKPITSPTDYNRDGAVNSTDQVISRDNFAFLLLPNIGTATASIAGRRIFYNESKWDGNNPAANQADSSAIATEKSAYLPGSGLIGPGSVTSYFKGINGIMVDLAGTHGTLTASDFIFKMSGQLGFGVANNTPSTWVTAPDPTAINVLFDTPSDGINRVEIIWANFAIVDRYLEVIVKGNDVTGGFNTNTGLAVSDIFFFGNKIGDDFLATPAGAFNTNSTDVIDARDNFALGVTKDNIYDYDRNGAVNSSDQVIARDNFGVLSRINIGSPPAAPEAAPAGATDDGVGSGSAIASALAAPSPSAEASTAHRLAPSLVSRPQVGAHPDLPSARLQGAPASEIRRLSAWIVGADPRIVDLALEDELLDDLLVGLEFQ